jgi:phosphoglycolate phosphatase-like HAD superfamily hydrolase
LLFDIDGTLILSAGAGRRAMDRSFKKVFGIENAFRDVQMMGRTDPNILMEALTNFGLGWNEKKVRRFRESYFLFLEEELEAPLAKKEICPGVLPLLSAIQGRQDLILGLLTGNWKKGGFLKLRYFGMDGYFSDGAFADDSPRREDLVPVALERFEKKLNTKFLIQHVYVIGDTPFDIQSARLHGVKTVGVATGFHPIEQLIPEKPDFLFQNLQDTEEVIKIF